MISTKSVNKLTQLLDLAESPKKRWTLANALVETIICLSPGDDQLLMLDTLIAQEKHRIAQQRELVDRVGSSGRDNRQEKTWLATLMRIETLFERNRKIIVDDIVFHPPKVNPGHYPRPLLMIPDFSGLSLSHESRPKAFLTPREREVLTGVAEGKTAAEIAAIFSISGRTVETHVRSIMRKLNASNRTQAVASAVRHRLI